MSCCRTTATPRCAACRSICRGPVSTSSRPCTIGSAPTRWQSSRTSASWPRRRPARCCSSPPIASAASRAPGATPACVGRLAPSPPAARRPTASSTRSLPDDDAARRARPSSHAASTSASPTRAAGCSAGPAASSPAFIYTDKPIYRPGHVVHVKSGAALAPHGRAGGLRPPDVEVAVADADRRRWSCRQRARVDEFGGAAIDVPLGAGAALGSYRISVTSGDGEATGSFEVQEYRRPEYEVIVTVASRFVVQGNDVVADVQARYYFGQPVANGTVHYVVDKQPYFSPLRWSDDADPDASGGWYGGELQSEGDLTLGADGRGQIRLPLDEDADGRDYRARIEARVSDASGREVSGAGVVHATVGLVPGRGAPRPVHGAAWGHRRRSGRAPSTTSARHAADVPVRVLVERLEYADGYYSAPTVTVVSETTARTDAAGQLSTQRRGSPTCRAATGWRWWRARASATCATTPGSGCRAHRGGARRRERLPRAARRQAQLRARRHRPRRGARPRRRRPGAAHQGRPARVVASGGAADRRRRVRDPDRRRAISATSTCTSRCCATAACCRPSAG